MTRARIPHLIGWSIVAILLFPWRAPELPRQIGQTRPTFVTRLIGPSASLAASVYWIRFDLALRDGEHDRAYVLAERALSLDAVAPEGWHTLARHLIFDRGSLESEPDPQRRRRWIEAGLAVFERGELETSDPGQLAYLRGTILTLYVAEIADAIDWPGGTEGALEDGRRSLERAENLGYSPTGASLKSHVDHEHAPR